MGNGVLRRWTTIAVIRGGMLAVAFGVALSGCGGGSRAAVKSASSQIKDAEDAMKRAEGYEATKQLDMAISAYQEARSRISEGKAFAKDRELRALKSLEEDLGPRLAAAEERKKKYDTEQREKRIAAEEKAKEEAALKAAAKSGAKTVAMDPAAEEKAKEEAARLKREADQKAAAEREKALAVTQTKRESPRGGDDEEPAGGAGGDGQAHAGAAAAKAEEAPKPPPGPFRELGANKPNLSIDKVLGKGDYAYAYIQVYNKNAEQNKRIGRVSVIFKDEGNGTLMQADGVFQYSYFDKNAKDPLDQPHPKCAVVAATHEVEGGKALQLVAIAMDKQRAQRAKKAAVTVDFEDGSSFSETGPGSIIEAEAQGAAGKLK